MKNPNSIFKVALLSILVSLIFQFQKICAQSYPVNFTGWYGWDGYAAFKEGKPWGLMGEAYWIRDDVFLKKNALFGRLGLNYYLKSGHRVNAGVAYQYNYPYDESSKPYNWPDYRLFQQYVMRFSKPKGMWQFRFRLEERWLGIKTDPSSHTFDHYQYETSAIIRVHKSFNLSEKFYAVLYDEVWLLFNTPDRMLDQNRAYAGIGTYIDKNKEWKLELGYMNQPNFNSSLETNDRSRLNHALRITIISEAPFKK